MVQPRFMGIRGRNCLITSFDPRGVNQADWDRIMRELHCSYVIAGLEQCPSTGKWHYHLYMEFDRPWAFARIKAYLPFTVNDIEPRFGSVKEMVAHVKKGDHYWEKGECSEQGHRTDLNSLYDEIRGGASLTEIVEHHVGAYVRYHKGIEKLMDVVRREQDRDSERVDVETIVYVGKSGTGKSHRCFNDPEQAPGKVFFDGYNGQRTIWFDEFGGTTLPFSLFLRLCDKWDNRVETKGGSVLVSGLRKVLISTTIYPVNWWLQSDKYLEDPRQLWRRLSRVYYIPRVPGYHCEPVLIDHPEGLNDSIANSLDAEAAAELKRRESERRRESILDLARSLRDGESGVDEGRTDEHARAGEHQRFAESDGGSEHDRSGADELGLYDVD